jgi:hypothetical protein
MASFLPVVPANYVKYITDKDYLPQRAFFLAHDVVAHKDEYAEATAPWKNPSGFGGFSILDNSVIELGNAVTLDMVLEAQSVVLANVVVLPDVLQDSKATQESTLANWDTWHKAFRTEVPDGVAPAELLFIPQGENLKNWVWCLEDTMSKLQATGYFPSWIGIPRNTTDRIVFSRTELINIVEMLFPALKIHLMGFSDDMVDDFVSARHPKVSSMDSAVPFRVPDFGITSEVGPRGDWWETASLKTQEELYPDVGNLIQKVNRMLDPLTRRR